jgi:hypothetical protein
MNAFPNPIEQGFELAASHCANLTPLVYQRLFKQHPETRAMFRAQGSEFVQGSMLALTIEAILDFACRRSGHFRPIACEVASLWHAARPLHRLLRDHHDHAARAAGRRMVGRDCAGLGRAAG